jgi:hypothetical protein
MKRGSPAEPFFGQRELNFSAGRRIGGRLSEIFPQLPPKPSRSPAAQKKKNPSHQAAGGHPRAAVARWPAARIYARARGSCMRAKTPPKRGRAMRTNMRQSFRQGVFRSLNGSTLSLASKETPTERGLIL